MSGVGAFGGDPAIKAALLARIDRHLCAGTLTFSETDWNGICGSALGISTEGTDPAAYAVAYGYPLPLAVLLDVLAGYPAGSFDAPAFVRAWVEVVRPGADLSKVPTELMLFMLEDGRLAGINDDIARELAVLHTRDHMGEPAGRSEWSRVRNAILALTPDAADRRRTLAIRMWEACAWPAARGRSTLADAFAAWRQLHGLLDDPTWSDADELRKESLLAAIWSEQSVEREADEVVDYHAHLIARDSDLADRFVANLTRVNGSIIGATATLAKRCIAAMQAAC